MIYYIIVFCRYVISLEWNTNENVPTCLGMIQFTNMASLDVPNVETFGGIDVRPIKKNYKSQVEDYKGTNIINRSVIDVYVA